VNQQFTLGNTFLHALNDSLTQQSEHFNRNITQSAHNQQQIYDALKHITEGIATLTGEVHVNRDQLLIAEKAEDETSDEFDRLNHVITTHEDEIKKHILNFNTVADTFNTWKDEVAATQQND
jgi:chromosome segregation ATPase